MEARNPAASFSPPIQANQPFSTLRKLFTAREGEMATFLLPTLGVATLATLGASPSMAKAVWEHSTWPDYVVKGLIIGGMLGVGWIIYRRLTTPMPTSDFLIKDGKQVKPDSYAALVKINGTIDKNTADKVLPLLKRAFLDPESVGVVIKINSGGGLPVQSSIIYEEILKWKVKTNKKVIVVGEDTLASGAYLIAVSADKIYVNANTLAGSIGVIMSSYGLQGLAEKVGIESRVFTSGENKHRLDPLKPVSEKDKEKIENIMKETHADFIRVVKTSRGDKLKGQEAYLFSGDVWTGRQAMELGLVDELGGLSTALEKEFNVVRFKEYKSDDWLGLSKLFQFGASAIGSEMASSEGLRFQYQQ